MEKSYEVLCQNLQKHESLFRELSVLKASILFESK